MAEEKKEPWTKEEFEDFNCVNRWSFDEKTTPPTCYLFNKSGPQKLEDYGFEDFLALDPESSPTIKVFLTSGTTGTLTPVQVTLDDFSLWNKTVKVPKALLKTRANSDDMGFLEYLIERDNDGISTVNIICDWAPYGNVYIWFIARMDYRENTLNVLVSSKRPLEDDALLPLMTENQDLLLEEPLHFIGLLYTASAGWCRSRVSSNVRELLEIEAEIGVTSDVDFFRARGYKLYNDDFEEINARLFNEVKAIATHKVYIEHLQDFGGTLLEIMQAVRKRQNPKLAEADGPWLSRDDRGTYELEYLDKRLKAVMHNLDYCHTLSQTLFQVLFNRMLQRDARLNYKVARAAKQDSTAMKTISILTLTFLPVTAVSSIFSGTMFDFTSWGVPGGRVASGGWWVWLLCSVLSTIITVGVWYAWLYKSEKKLDSEELKESQKEAEKAEEEAEEEEEETKGNDEDAEKRSIRSTKSNKSNASRPPGFSLRSRKSTRYSVSEAV